MPLLVSAAFLLVDAFAAPRLLTPRLEDYEPIEIERNREELAVVASPVSAKPLLRHEGTADLNLDVEAETARLDADSFVLVPGPPPAEWGKIRVFSAVGSPGRINLTVDGGGAGSPRKIELHLAALAGDPQRSLRLTAEKVDLRVTVELLEGRRNLRLGNRPEIPVYDGAPLLFVVARGSPLQLTFDRSNARDDVKPAPELLNLSQLPLHSIRIKTPATGTTRLALESRTGKPDLLIDDIRTAGDRLQLTGSGPFSAFGTGVPAMLASRHPVAGAAIILALLAHAWPAAWLVRALPHRRSHRGSPPSVFISYSHEDEAWKDRLVKHLGVLAAEGALEIWDDRRIGPGEDWLQAIETAMSRARVAVLLVSADFLTSRFIRSTEIPRFLERRKDNGLRVIPLIVHPCAWQAVDWLAAMQCRPRDGRPLSAGRKAQIDADLAALALEIRDLLRIKPAAPAP